METHSEKLNFMLYRTFSCYSYYPYGVVELQIQSYAKTFKVNGQCLKHFHENPTLADEMVEEIDLQILTYPET